MEEMKSRKFLVIKVKAEGLADIQEQANHLQETLVAVNSELAKFKASLGIDIENKTPAKDADKGSGQNDKC